jgi:rhodanese-related sulfurtransferase
VTSPAPSRPASYTEWTAEEVDAARGRVRVVDVREPSEFTGELGHVPGADLVPLGALERAAAAWDRARPVVLVCRSGARSARAAALLASMGFATSINLRGGMIAWNALSLPVERTARVRP